MCEKRGESEVSAQLELGQLEPKSPQLSLGPPHRWQGAKDVSPYLLPPRCVRRKLGSKVELPVGHWHAGLGCELPKWHLNHWANHLTWGEIFRSLEGLCKYQQQESSISGDILKCAMIYHSQQASAL